MPLSFVCWAAWLAGTSWVGMTLMQAGRFSAAGSVAGGLVFACVVGGLAARVSRPRARESIWIAALALALCTTLVPAIDTTLLSQDASVHRAAGRWLAREGGLGVPDPTLEIVDPQARLALFSGGSHTDKRTSLVRIPGGLVIPDFDETTAYPSFSHLLSVWIALALSFFGDAGPRALGLLFAFSAWWAVGLIAWRDAGLGAAVAAVALLATWLPEHWFGRFLMPEILAQALVWSGVALARLSMDLWGLDRQGRAGEASPSVKARRGGWAVGFAAGLSLGVAAFARLEQFWVFIPALLLVRVFTPPARWVLPPGAVVPLLATGLQGLFHLWWMPTDYGNRIYKTAAGLGLQLVLVLAKLVRGDGYLLGVLLERVLPVLLLLVVAGLLFWGWRLERRAPGSRFRPLLIVLTVVWLGQLYSRGLPTAFPVLAAMLWYIPWPLWGALCLGLPSLLALPGLELALILESLDQVVFGRVSPEHVWASRRLVTVALPVLALAATRGAFGAPLGGRLGRLAGRVLVVVALVIGAWGIAPMVGVPFQSGAREFVADFAEDIPEGSTVVLVKPLDWLHLGSALWLGEGRHAIVLREEGYPGYDEALAQYLSSRARESLFVVAGAVVGPEGGDDEARGELARLPQGLRLERLSTYVWKARFLEVTHDRRPQHEIERRAFLHLYRAHPAESAPEVD